MNFEIDKLMDFVPARKPRNKAIAVFIHASNQVVCHTDVDCPARAACEDINIELSHGLAFLSEMAGTSPAMTSREVLEE
jgi:hypothetical protein